MWYEIKILHVALLNKNSIMWLKIMWEEKHRKCTYVSNAIVIHIDTYFILTSLEAR